jgi:hypothetical protein
LNELSEPARPALAALLARGGAPTAADLAALDLLDAATLDAALAAFADEHGAAALPALTALGARGTERKVRRAARRALYRLEQRGITAATPAPAPIVGRRPARPARAWASGIDGTGSRATWIVFEGEYGALRLCSLILNDTAGILEVAGGDVTRKRLERELAELRASQKLPWVELAPAHAVSLVAAALALHRAAGTSPPPAFARWQPLFDAAVPAPPPGPAGEVDEARAERSAELLELPEMAGWFLEPERVQADAVDLLQARESRLVVSDQIRAEREEAIVRRVVERELDVPARRLWAGRLLEMSRVFEAAGRGEHAALARAAGDALLDEGRDATRLPFARALAARALDVAGEVSLGRLSAAEASRKPAGPGVAPA